MGLFVFDRAHAPKNLESLQRIGVDIFVVWDSEDQITDLYLRTAVSLARSLAHREVAARTRGDADLAALDGLVESIAAHLTTLGSIEKAARSVRKNGDAILKDAESMRDALERETEALRKHISAQRESA